MSFPQKRKSSGDRFCISAIGGCAFGAKRGMTEI